MGNGRKGGEIGGGTRRGWVLRVTRPTNYLTLDALEFYLFVPQGFSRCKSSPCEHNTTSFFSGFIPLLLLAILLYLL